MKDVIELLTSIEKGMSPIDAVLRRKIQIILDEGTTDPSSECLALSVCLTADLQMSLLRYQQLYKKSLRKKYNKGQLPEGIIDFSFTVTSDCINADYYDDRIKGDARMNINNMDLFNWIKSMGYNQIQKNPLGPEEIEEEIVIKKAEEFLNYYLEQWHVIAYLIDKNIF